MTTFKAWLVGQYKHLVGKCGDLKEERPPIVVELSGEVRWCSLAGGNMAEVGVGVGAVGQRIKTLPTFRLLFLLHTYS